MWYDRDKYVAASQFGLPLSELLPKNGDDYYWWCVLQENLPSLDYDSLGFVHICPSWCQSSNGEKERLMQLARLVMQQQEEAEGIKYFVGHYGGSNRDEKHLVLFGPCDVSSHIGIGDALGAFPNATTLIPEYMMKPTTDQNPLFQR